VIDLRGRRGRLEEIERLLQLLRSTRDRLAESLVATLGDACAALRADIQPLAQLSDERRADAEVQTYLVERSVERLAPALGRGILARAAEDAAAAGEAPLPLEPSELSAPLRATLAGAAAAYRSGPHLAGEPLRATVEQCLTALADALDNATPVPHALRGDRALTLRLGALVRALAGSATETVTAP
jgi:hypothetical protein